MTASTLRLLGRLSLFAVILSTALTVQADLIGFWTFDEQTPEDFSGFGHDGSLAGSTLPTYSADIPPITGSGFSLSVPGGDAHVLVPHSETLDVTGEITIAAWVKTAANGWDAILAKNPSDGSAANHAGNYELRIENGTRGLNFLHQQGGENDTVGHIGPPVGDATWQHVAITAVAGGDLNYYINGALVDTQSIPVPTFPTNNSPLYIGSRADLFTTMDGLLDDVRLYNEILTADDILDLAGGPVESYPALPVRGATASSEFISDGRLAIHAVDRSGLFGKTHGTAPQGTMWLTQSGDPAPELVIDLGIVHAVDELRIWNYNENANPDCCLDRGVQTFDVFMAGRDGVFPDTPVLTGATLTRAPGASEDFSEVIDLGGAPGRYIKLAATSNYGDPSFTGLSEVNVCAGGPDCLGSPVPGKAPIQNVVATASTGLAGGFRRGPEFLTDGSGLKYADGHTITPDGFMWLSNGSFTDPNDLDPEVTFDFGEVKMLEAMKIWNYNETLEGREDELLGRGVQEMDVYFAGEDGEFFLIYPELTLFRGPGEEDVDFGEEFDLGGVPARFIKFDILSNYNGADFGGGGDDGLANFAGLSEVQFFELVVGGLACDFDGDELCALSDINGLLYDGIPNQNLTYDIDGNGIVDEADTGEWLNQAGNENIGVPYVHGDSDLNGVVDASDLNRVGISWQRTDATSWDQGDFDGDGLVNASDLNFIGLNWLHGTAPAAAVPEPAGLGLWLLTLLAICRGRAKTHVE